MRNSVWPEGFAFIGEEQISEVDDSLRSGWVTTGPKVQRFEQEFAVYTGARHAVAVNSCTAALHASLAAVGVVGLEEERSFVMADIPGLIAGAHEGKGLGMRFLRHVERTRLLLHLIDVAELSGRDPVDDYGIILNELASFSPVVAAKP